MKTKILFCLLLFASYFCNADTGMYNNGYKSGFTYPVGCNRNTNYMFPSFVTYTYGNTSDTMIVTLAELETTLVFDSVSPHNNVINLVVPGTVLAGAKLYIQANSYTGTYNLVLLQDSVTNIIPVGGVGVCTAFVYNGSFFNPLINSEAPGTFSGDTSILVHLRLSSLASHSANQLDSAAVRIDTNGNVQPGCYFSCADTSNGNLATQHMLDSLTGGDGNGWSLTGNAGTNTAVNFVGTTDANGLEFRMNNEFAGELDSTDTYNTSFGYETNDNSGYGEVSIGVQALQNNASNYNVAIGPQAMQNTSGGYNIAIGYLACSKTSGYQNTAVGIYSMLQSAGTQNNVALGMGTLYWDTSGNDNTAVGFDAMYNTNAANNVAVGYEALFNNTKGSGNVVIGYNACYEGNPSNRLFIDNQVRTDSATQEKQSLITGTFGADSSQQNIRINGKLQISDGTAGVNRVFTSDSVGDGSWQIVPGAIVASVFDSALTVSDTVMTYNSTGVNRTYRVGGFIDAEEFLSDSARVKLIYTEGQGGSVTRYLIGGVTTYTTTAGMTGFTVQDIRVRAATPIKVYLDIKNTTGTAETDIGVSIQDLGY